MFDSLKITTSYLSFYCFWFLNRSQSMKFVSCEPNRIRIFRCSCVKNFRESYVFHCLVIKVVCLRLSADSSFIISLAFCFVKNFFIFFFKFFFHLHQQLRYNIMSSVSCQHFFYIFFNFIQPNLCCLSKKIRLTQKRIYHIIIFFLRQVLFYIFLHIFYTISDIAIISSFLTPQYQSKD